jgi:hypothetical protein
MTPCNGLSPFLIFTSQTRFKDDYGLQHGAAGQLNRTRIHLVTPRGCQLLWLTFHDVNKLRPISVYWQVYFPVRLLVSS